MTTLDALCKQAVKITSVKLDNEMAHVRPISGTARAEVEQLWAKTSDGDMSKLDMIAFRRIVIGSALCDLHGEPLCKTDADIDRVMDLPWQTVNQIFDAAIEASGMADEAVEDAEKNSEPAA